MATSKIKSSSSQMMLYEVFNQRGGRYYTLKVNWITDVRRFVIMILYGTQNGVSKIATGVVSNVETPSSIIFNDSAVSYDASTSTITVDAEVGAWVVPIIVYPQGHMAVSVH